jgi:excinuclease UvrABC ATPase subunit
MNNTIRIRGAKKHNLKSLDLDIPKGQFIVITGVSGSGKSTLAFDLLYREGRRRYDRAVGEDYFEDEEGFDEMTGLVPTVAVEQRIIRQSNPRSLVGTRTRLLGLMQIVFSFAGRYTCSCGGQTDERRVCSDCGHRVEPLPTAYFNFHSPLGMCLGCFGTGRVSTLTEEQALQGRNRVSLMRGTPGKLKDGLKRLGKAYGFDPNDFYSNLSPEAQRAYLDGDLSVGYEGLMPFLRRIGAGAEGAGSTVCPSCNGTRLGEEARRITIEGLNISALAEKTLKEQAHFWEDLSGRIAGADPHLAPVLNRIRTKIDALLDVGLSHLSLYRRTPTLSGGELQRLFLASHLDSELEGLIYIFDEPSVGLHEREKDRLIQRLKELKSLGNSVIVVEHDPGIIRAADWIIEIGPGAGEGGGRIVYQGNLEGYFSCAESLIASFISQRGSAILAGFGQQRHRIQVTDQTPRLTIHHANIHNLKNITVSFPLGVMVGVAGVSGSGKSSLVASTLVPMLAKWFDSVVEDDPEEDVEKEDAEQLTGVELQGAEWLSGVSLVAQAPIGRSKTSTPVSYIGVWDRIRSLYAGQKEAKEVGLSPGDFSFNSTGGCSECGGEGTIRKETREYTFTWPCHICGGTRYRPEVLDIIIGGKNIANILEMSVDEAIDFFKWDSAISGPLKILQEVGMGYLKLGQPADTISGGEAQRIKLAKELGRGRSGGILYILDEPTTGLSCVDVGRLLGLLRRLVDRGNTVLLIEHDLSVLSECDWIIEMGPGGGDEGGEVIAEGSPELLAHLPASVIGTYWREGIGG